MSVILLIRKRTLLSAWLLSALCCLSAVFWSGSRQASVPVLSAEQESGRLQAVVIDPGHGGQDGGAVAPGRYGGESDQSGDFPEIGTAAALCRRPHGDDPPGGLHGLRSRP